MSIEKVANRYLVPFAGVIDPKQFIVVQMDGHKFGDLTVKYFNRPIDPAFEELMISSTQGVMRDEVGREFTIAYVKSDEACFLLPPGSTLFGRHPDMIATNISGHMSATFTDELRNLGKGGLGIFYGKVYQIPTVEEVKEFYAERQFDGYVNFVGMVAIDFLKRKGLETNGINVKTQLKIREWVDLLKRYDHIFPSAKAFLKFGTLIHYGTRKEVTPGKVEGQDLVRSKRVLYTNRELGWFRDNNPNLEEIIFKSLNHKQQCVVHNK
jgi:tRNA(His) 5'-end guanylyltransferase